MGYSELYNHFKDNTEALKDLVFDLINEGELDKSELLNWYSELINK